jgi:ABC-type nickel/cobalt efflux system permease component RcnA
MTPGPGAPGFAELAKHLENPKMQAALQWVGIGSAVVLTLGGLIHLYRDLTRPHHDWHPEPYPKHRHRALIDDLDRHHRSRHGHER